MAALALPCTPPTATTPCFFVPGPLQVWVGTGAAAAMEFLGYTRGGSRFTEQMFYDELRSDASGGDRGPMADAQLLGETHFVDLEMAQFTNSILDKLEKRVPAGATRTKGMLLICGSAYFRLVLISTNFARNYTKAMLLEPIDRPSTGVNTLYPRLAFTCLEDSGNTTANGAPYTGAPWDLSITVNGAALS